MIQAIRNGKVKLERNEDSLTSSIFQLLSYLPNKHLFCIISAALRNKIKKELGQLLSMSFWPKWDASGIESNKSFIEPDVFIRFDNMDIIVEAKRYDDKGQYQQQWQNEFQAYLNEYPESEKAVTLWALGGINTLNDDHVERGEQHCDVYKSTWTMLLDAIQSEYQKLASYKHSPYLERLFADLIYSFQFHGFFVGEWFSDRKMKPIGFSAISLDYFLRNKQRFDSNRWLYSLTNTGDKCASLKTIEKWKTPN